MSRAACTRIVEKIKTTNETAMPDRTGRQQEDAMAKGQAKGNKEAKKPKADNSRPKGSGSAYKQAQAKGGATPIPFAKLGSFGKKS
jgi:hypothetical protein